MTYTSPNTATQIEHWKALKADAQAIRSRCLTQITEISAVLGDLPHDDPRGFYDRQKIDWHRLQIEHCERDIARYDAWLDGNGSIDNRHADL